jgi:hypothetical protein
MPFLHNYSIKKEDSMGFLDRLFDKEKNFPELDASSQTAKRIDRFRHDLENLVNEVHDSLEVVPTDDTAYVFIGKPPKNFGVAWIRDGKINNFKTLVQDHGVPEMKLQLISERLREAYQKNDTASRFSTSIADQKIIVTESHSLAQELREIIR